MENNIVARATQLSGSRKGVLFAAKHIQYTAIQISRGLHSSLCDVTVQFKEMLTLFYTF